MSEKVTVKDSFSCIVLVLHPDTSIPIGRDYDGITPCVWVKVQHSGKDGVSLDGQLRSHLLDLKLRSHLLDLKPVHMDVKRMCVMVGVD
jgi:hypothetical protein